VERRYLRSLRKMTKKDKYEAIIEMFMEGKITQDDAMARLEDVYNGS